MGLTKEEQSRLDKITLSDSFIPTPDSLTPAEKARLDKSIAVPKPGVSPFTLAEGKGLEDPMLRLGAALAKNPQEAVDFLNRKSRDAKAGYEFNLTQSGEPEVVYRKKGETSFKRIDAPLLKTTPMELMSDVAEAAPTLAEMGATGVGASYGGPIGAGLAGAGVEGAKQALGGLLEVPAPASENETMEQFLQRLAPDMGEMAKAGIVSGLGEFGGSKALRALEKQIRPSIGGAFKSATGKTIERPIYPSERFGKIGEGIDKLYTEDLKSVFPQNLAKKDVQIAEDVLSGSEKYFAPGKEKSLTELNLETAKSLKKDLERTAKEFNQAYTDIGDALGDERIKVGEALDKLRSLDMSPDNASVVSEVEKKLTNSKTIKELYNNMRDLTNYRSGLLGGKAIAKEGQLAKVRDIVDEAFVNELSLIPQVKPTSPGYGNTGRDLVEYYKNINEAYGKHSKIKESFDKALKTKAGEYTIIDKLSSPTGRMLESEALPEYGVELPSEKTAELFGRGLAKGVGEKTTSLGKVDFQKLESFFKDPKGADLMKRLLTAEKIDPDTLTQYAKHLEKAGDYAGALDVLKQIVSSKPSIGARAALKEKTPIDMSTFLPKTARAITGGLASPLSQLLYNPGGAVGRMAASELVKSKPEREELAKTIKGVKGNASKLEKKLRKQ